MGSVATTWNGRTPADVTDAGVTYGRNQPYHEVDVMAPVVPAVGADPTAPEPPVPPNPSYGRAWGIARHTRNFYLDPQYSDDGIAQWPQGQYGKAPLDSPTGAVPAGRQLPFRDRINIPRPNYISYGDATDMATLSAAMPGM
jgi:hypothetical protein